MSAMLPERISRLFTHYDEIDPGDPAVSSLVLAKVMEEGDGRDLHWLTSIFSETELEAWCRQQGQRQLSRRSLAFWNLLLTIEFPSTGSREDQLWPL